MSHIPVIGFVVVAVGGLAFADYTIQSGKTDQPYSVSDYVGSFSQRLNAAKEERAAVDALAARRAAPLRDHLPPAPDGWVRRDWGPQDKGVLSPPDREISAEEAEMMEDIAKTGTGALLLAADKKAGDRAEAERLAQTYVYENGPHRVSIRLKYRDMPTEKKARGVGGLQQGAMQMVVNNMTAMTPKEGWGIVQGVRFQENFGLMGERMWDDSKKDSYRLIQGRIGKQVKIEVRALAPDHAILALLAMTDMDGLNARLDTPVEGVGLTGATAIGEDAIRLIEEDIKADTQRRMAQNKEIEQDFENFANAFSGKKVLKSQDSTTKDSAAVEQPTDVKPVRADDIDEGALARLVVQDTDFDGDAIKAEMEAKIAKVEEEAEAQRAEEANQPMPWDKPASQMSRGDKLALGMHLATRGIEPQHLEGGFDGRTSTRRQEAKDYATGRLGPDHPAYLVRKAEAEQGLTAGSCISLADKRVFCGDAAKPLRKAYDLRKLTVAARSETTVTPEPKVEAKPEIKVNRGDRMNSDTRRAGKSETFSTGGVTTVCEMVGDRKRCKIVTQ